MLHSPGYGPPFRRRRRRGVPTSRGMMTVLGAAVAASLLLGFHDSPSGAPGASLPGIGAVPAPGSQSAPLAGGEQAIVNKIKPGLVIVNTTLQYNSEAAAGTGIVINADGLVLTNNHVIDHATKITATAASTGTTYTATVVGYDKTGDIALIQLRNASGLTAARLRQLLLGQDRGTPSWPWATPRARAAITAKPGRVTGLGQTVTASEDGGSTASETLHGMIQTNADIVPGDSGGPLVSSAAVIGRDTPGNDGKTSRRRPGSRSRSTRHCRSPGRSPRARPAPAPPSPPPTPRFAGAFDLVPDRPAAPRRRHSSRAAASAAASGTPRGATPAIPA